MKQLRQGFGSSNDLLTSNEAAMRKISLLLLLLSLSSCASMISRHRMKAANRKLHDTQSLQSQGQWAAARLMANGMRSSVSQSVADKPVRKSASGAELDLRPLLTAWENGAWKKLAEALDEKDAPGFTRAYATMKQQCTSCHLALGLNEIQIAE